MLAVLLLGATLATVGAGASSLAYFTSTASNTGSWSSGTIILGVSPSTTWTATNIFPGDTGSRTVTVSSTGSGQLRYSMSTAISGETNALASQLALKVETGACGSTTGTIYNSGLTGAAFGPRVLDPASSEQLCFTWTFASTATSSYQASTATATFTFDAVQTKNN